jgi:hypothetical protein
MDWIRIFLNRCASLFGKKKLDQELDDELHSHLEFAIDENLRRGLSRQEARIRALKEFGGLTQIRESYRVQRGVPLLESVGQDLRYALRRLSKSPGFTIVALLTLALGIGANTGIFTVLDTVLLKSLPVPHPEQLFIVKRGGHAADKSRFPYRFFDHVRQRLPATAAIAAMGWPVDFYTSTAKEQPQPTQGQLVSGNYFQVFETYPVLGRLLTPADDEKLGGSPVTVLSYGYWQLHFAADPNVIGRKLEVNHVPFTIVGVAPRGFFGART